MTLLFISLSAAALLGCADNKPTSKKPTSPLVSAMKSQWDHPQNGAGNGSAGANADGSGAGGKGAGVDTPMLHVSGEIARICDLPRPSANTMFDFDSTAIGEGDRDVLAALAKCLTDGPLKGRGIALTGRADARGEMEYNMTLGEARADSVKRYLHDLGVQAERVNSTSRGEIDATGTDDTSWALDRRVDVDLQ